MFLKKKSIFYRLALIFFVFLFVFSSGPAVALAAEISADSYASDSQDAMPETGNSENILSDTAELLNEKVSSVSQVTEINGVAPENLLDEEKEKTLSPLPQEEAIGAVTLSAVSTQSDPLLNELREPLASKLNVKPDQSTGALTYSYPINTPPGRNGMQPDLMLNYNSQDGNLANVFGYGWSVNIPYIERLNKRGVDKLYSDNKFYSSLSGEINPIASASGIYKAKIENGDFFEYRFANGYWLASDKTGATYAFGQTTATRQDDSGSAKAFKWMLEKVTDRNGNYVKYEYFKDNGQIYPSKIKYTGNTNGEGIFEVEFLREGRIDAGIFYNAGFLVKNNYRVNEIKTKINGAVARKYDLHYSAGDNTTQSLLKSVTETGIDEQNNSIVLPDTVFKYQTKNLNWTENSKYTIPIIFSGRSDDYRDYGVRIADINGDGYADIMKSNDYTNETYINNHNGTGCTASSTWSLPNRFVNRNGWDMGVRLLDVNGDGRLDVIRSIDSDYNQIYSRAHINNGHGWTEDPAWAPPISFVKYNGDPRGVLLGDVNGDGLVDIVRSANLNDEFNVVNKEVWINKGADKGWAKDSNYEVPAIFGYEYNRYKDLGYRLTDVNGDGLADIIHGGRSSNEYEVYINKGNGTGWVQNDQWKSPTGFVGYYGGDSGTRLADINNDGLVDFVSAIESNTSVHSVVYLNTGRGWVESENWNFPHGFINGLSKPTGMELADIDGDGLLDILYAHNNSDDWDDNSDVKKVYIANGANPNLLNEVANSTGSKFNIEYKATPQYKVGSNLLNQDLPIVMQTVSRITGNDGLDNISTKTYEYSKGAYYFNNPYNKRFAGFGAIKETNDYGRAVINYFHQGNISDSVKGEYEDGESKIWRIYRTETYDSAGKLFSKSINKWVNFKQAPDRDFVYLAQTLDFNYDGNSTHRDKATIYNYNTANGNLVQKTFWGEVTGADSGTFTDIGADMASATINYTTGTGFVSAFPSGEITYNQGGTKVRETKYYYDNLGFGAVAKGNLTKKEDWKSGTSYVDVEKSYNSYGLVTKEKDPRDKAMNYTYDAYNLYPATITNALNQAISFTYDYSLGKPKKTIDSNNNQFEIVYDGLDRAVAEKQPDLTIPGASALKTSYQYNDLSIPRSSVKTDYLDAIATHSIYTYLDGLGRMIQIREQAESANQYSVKDFQYNKIGLVSLETLPYFSYSSNYTPLTTNTNLYLRYSYDPLERITVSSNVIGKTLREYDDWKTKVTDQNGKIKVFYRDAYDNLARVNEHYLSSIYATFYSYNLLGKLNKISDALGNVRNFSYDGLGRLTAGQDLHAANDTTFGSYTYTYDDAGNLIQKIDPKNQTVNYAYDDLNRVITEDYIGQSGVEVTNGYDTCVFGKGKLCAIATADLATNYAYNALGLIKNETKKIASVDYNTEYSYDRLGNITNIKYPDNSEVKYDYNGANALEKVSQKESGANSYNAIISDFNYNPVGAVKYKKYGNNIETNYTYSPNQLYRLAGVETAKGSVASTAIFYSLPGDGLVYANSATGWSAARDTTIGTSDYTSASGNFVNSWYNLTYKKFGVARNFLPFDTGALPDDSQIVSAKLSVYPNSKSNNDNDGVDFLTVVRTYQGQTASLSGSDYDDCGSDNGLPGRAIYAPVEGVGVSERKDITNIPISQYLSFNLNPTGLSWIDKTGFTKLGIREGHDTTNHPVLSTAGTFSGVKINYSEAVGASTDPKLEVVYRAPKLQSLAYSYDKAGNIIKLIDNSETSNKKIVYYTYDDLHRLTKASTTDAVGNKNYFQTYAYNAIGNFTNKSDVGAYQYTGNQGTNYANPHAATVVNAVPYTYDKNGNLTSNGAWTNTWDYRNRLVKSVKGGAVVLYAYDSADNRFLYSVNGATTTTVNKFFENQGANTTKYIYAGDQLVANIVTGSSSSETYYVETDHLGGSSVVTDKNGKLTELLDYYPFGAIRLDEKSGTFNERKKFTGHEYDAETGLNYMSARYQDGSIGRFISQDPAFLAVGNDGQSKEITGQELRQYLSDPQNLNSYSYVKNNPLVAVDPNGKWIELIIGEKNAVNLGNWASNNTVARYATDHPFQTGAVLGVAGGAAVAGGVLIGGGAITCGALCGPVAGTIATGGTTLSTQTDKIERTVENGRKLLNGPINITADRLNHVLDEHTIGGANTAGKSIFNAGENIVNLIKSGIQQPIIKQSFGNNFQRVFDAGRNIGVDRVTGQQTSIMSIITNSAGRMITAFPGIPAKP